MTEKKSKFFEVVLFVYVLSIILFAYSPSYSYVSYFAGILLTLFFLYDKIIEKDIVIYGFTICHTLFVCFLIICAIGILFRPEGIKRFYTILQIFILSIVISESIVKRNTLSTIKYSVLVGCLYSCFVVTLQNLGQNFMDNSMRLGSTLENPNAFALALLVGCTFCLHEFMDSLNRSRPFRKFGSLALIILFGYYILYFTGSRKGIILLLFLNFVVFLYLLARCKFKGKLIVFLSFPIIETLVGYFLYNSPHFNRILNLYLLITGVNVSESSISARKYMLLKSIDLWTQKPLFGWGIDQFRFVSGLNRYSHNNYSEILVNHGLIGFVVYYGMFLSIIFLITKNIKQNQDFAWWALSSTMLLLISDFGMVSYYSKINWILLSTIMGMTKLQKL